MVLRLKFVAFFLIVIFVGCSEVSAQTVDSYEYQSEFIWGFNKNTSGGLLGGVIFKKGRKRTERMLETLGLELINLKHPQEVRVTSLSTGNYFIRGKLNYMYAIRLQYGRDLILFKKAPHQGVEIKASFAAGPTIGLQAPYYVEYGNGSGFTFRAPYTSNIAIEQIVGSGRLFEGIGDSKIIPGINLKAAMNFELGTVKTQVTGFEAGFLVDAYAKTTELMAVSKNYSVFPTFFITLFYGTRK